MPRKYNPVAYQCAHCAGTFHDFPCRAKHGRSHYCSLDCKYAAMSAASTDPVQLFWQQVDRSAGCWEWRGNITSHDGYGRFHVRLGRNARKNMKVHRYAWEITYGPIPDSLHVCHRCDNRRCVRPDHLFLGTHAINMADRNAKHRHAHGERAGNVKLTTAQVQSIRQRCAAGESQGTMSREFGVSRVCIHKVVARKTWVHI